MNRGGVHTPYHPWSQIPETLQPLGITGVGNRMSRLILKNPQNSFRYAKSEGQPCASLVTGSYGNSGNAVDFRLSFFCAHRPLTPLSHRRLCVGGSLATRACLPGRNE